VNPALLAAGIILCVLGIALFFALRTDTLPQSLRRSALRSLSPISHAVIALSLIGLGYHFLAYAMNWTHFRAPLGIAIAVAIAAVTLSILTDMLEKRGEEQ